MMLLALSALLAAGAYVLPAPLQRSQDAPRPLQQLMDDLGSAAGRARLSNAQKDRVESDREVLRSALKAKDQGQPVDRQQVVLAVRDIRNLVDSGAFPASDKNTLLADIETLRKHR